MSNNRRQFLQRLSGIAAVSATPHWLSSAHAAVVGTNAQWASASDATLWGKAWALRFTNKLPNPLAAASLITPSVGTAEYTVTAGQTTANILGVPNVLTTVWGYQGPKTAVTYPGPTFEVTQGTPITVHWINGLVDAVSKQPLPHILPIDQTITIQTPTTGVPLAVHHHGGENAAEFDGTPDQWATPLRKQSGPGITGNAKQVSFAQAITYVYDNTQEASLHWYHDHAESLTAVNVNAGLAGLYVVRDKNEAALRANKTLPPANNEVALVIQDRTVDARGQLVYGMDPTNSNTTLPATFPAGSPSHLPEMFGDIMVVNGVAWPVMTVAPRKYRFRLLNGSDSRFLTLTLSDVKATVDVIGNDLGFLNQPSAMPIAGLVVAPGERYDLVIDFSAVTIGTAVDLLNGAVTPFPVGGAPTAGMASVMRFQVATTAPTTTTTTSTTKTSTGSVTTTVVTTVTDAAGGTTTTVATTVATTINATKKAKATTTSKTTTTTTLTKTCLLAKSSALRGANGTKVLAVPKPAATTPTRRILLGEGTDKYGRTLPMLGTYDPTGVNNLGTLSFQDPTTEKPAKGSTEVWEFWNTTPDAHPVHMHLVNFRILTRQAFTPNTAITTMSNGSAGVKLLPTSALLPTITAAGAWEAGQKDTVICPPSQVTRVLVTFPRAGKYVYHCHILSHEDHDMMRWYQVI